MFHSKEVKFTRDYGRRDLHLCHLCLPHGCPLLLSLTVGPLEPAVPPCGHGRATPDPWQWARAASYSLWEWDWGLVVSMRDGNPTDTEFRLLWPRRQMGMASCTGELQRADRTGT